MAHKPPPTTGFVESLTRVHNRVPARWTNADGNRLYEWNTRHGEWEIYDKRDNHLGTADGDTGVLIKKAVRGRTINV